MHRGSIEYINPPNPVLQANSASQICESVRVTVLSLTPRCVASRHVITQGKQKVRAEAESRQPLCAVRLRPSQLCPSNRSVRAGARRRITRLRAVLPEIFEDSLRQEEYSSPSSRYDIHPIASFIHQSQRRSTFSKVLASALWLLLLHDLKKLEERVASVSHFCDN